jgi:hypothetical protein
MQNLIDDEQLERTIPYMRKKGKEKSNQQNERDNPSAIVRKQHIAYGKERELPR